MQLHLDLEQGLHQRHQPGTQLRDGQAVSRAEAPDDEVQHEGHAPHIRPAQQAALRGGCAGCLLRAQQGSVLHDDVAVLG